MQIIDLRSGAVVHGLKPEGMVTETYDVVTLPGSIHPKASGFKPGEIQRILATDGFGVL